MIVDRKREFMFVCVAKTASTSIRRRFGYFQDPPPEEYHMFLEEGLKQHSYAKDYFKFAFVRNPYVRIFSIYKNFKQPNNHPWDTEIKKMDTFESFILDLEIRCYKNYIHLQPQFHYVKLGSEVGVDFLGRYENLNEDFNKVETFLGLPFKELQKIRVSEDPYLEPNYTDEMKEVVQRVYAEDFERFSYEK
jgi:chondroitin 4-sulfotransferase 11